MKKKSNLFTNLALSFILIVICTFAYWYEFSKKKDLDFKKDAETKLLALDSNAEVEKLQIVEKLNLVHFEFKCSEKCKVSDPGAKWQITVPIEFKADEGNISSFISAISNAVLAETLALDGDLEAELRKFGLDKARRDYFFVEIKLKDKEKPYRVYFGDPSAVGESLYAYVERPDKDNSRKVYLVPSYLKNSLQKNLSYWRNKKLFNFTPEQIKSLRLTNQNKQIRFEKKENSWYFTNSSGKTTLADPETMDSYLVGLVFTHATSFVSDDRKKDASNYGIVPNAHYSAEVELVDTQKVQLKIYEKLKGQEPKVFGTLSNNNTIFELDRPTLEKFRRKESYFRYKKLISPDEKLRAKEVIFSASNQEQTLSPDDENLAKIGSVKIEEFVETTPKEIEKISTWKLVDENKKTIKQLEIHQHKPSKTVFVRIDGKDWVKMEKGSEETLPLNLSAPKK